MTLYRVAKNSQVVEALIDAAENGKEVVVMLNLEQDLMNRTILSGQGEWKMQDAELFTESTIQKFIKNLSYFI